PLLHSFPTRRSSDLVPGTDVTLSLDVAIQSNAEDVLGDVDSPAGLVALQPSTGQVLAAASSPGADGLDMAMAAELAPGSTFKVRSEEHTSELQSRFD